MEMRQVRLVANEHELEKYGASIVDAKTVVKSMISCATESMF
jgi:hypothetical protein